LNKARKIVKADIAHAMGFTGRGVGIAILDTGTAAVDDLTKPVNRITVFKDIVNNISEPYDDNGHGTQVAYL